MPLTSQLPNCRSQAYLCSGAGINLSLVATFEIAYAHLHGERGVALPATWQQIVKNIRPRAGQDGIVSVYETLTHGLPEPPNSTLST